MTNEMIPRAQWTIFFDRFSLNHQGASVVLEMHDPKIGDQLLASDQVFRGISADEKDGENRIAIMIGARDDDSTTHAVMAPEGVRHQAAQGAGSETLEILCARDSSTVLRFAAPPLGE